ncbi:MAG: hypothetical protein GC152_03715 [Alphaproteobacteria bacterium]|nr:hypothetical protein [Alphaproteobacteria bacterium]
MVQEVRHLFFTTKEVIDALDGFRARHKEFLPAGVIRLKGVAKDGSVRVEIDMSYGVRSQRGSFDIASNDVLRSLICACSDLGIPLPREGKKSLAGSVAGVVLKVRVDLAAFAEGNDVSLDAFEHATPLEKAS